MTSYFVENAKPKTNKSKRFKIWKSIASIETVPRVQNPRPTPEHPSVDHNLLKLVDECNEKEFVGRFMTTSWEETSSEHVMDIKRYSTSGDNYMGEHLINIDKYSITDSTEKQNYIAFDKDEETKCIFAKVSRNRAKFHLATDKKIKLLRRYAHTMVGAKPKVVRGKKCDSWNYNRVA